MKAYIPFLYKSIFHNKGTYISAGLFFFILILITYILPHALNIKFTFLLSVVVIFVIVIFSISIFSILLATSLFRQGIDDGSEILVISKPLSRTQIVLSKLIVFISIVLIASFIAFIIPIFLMFDKLGVSHPWDYAGGYFLTTLIGSFLFGSISILLSLIFSKGKATLITVGITALLGIFTTVNFQINSSPGYFNRIKHLDLYSYTIPMSNTEGETKNFNGSILAYEKIPITKTTKYYNGELIIDQGITNLRPDQIMNSIYSISMKNSNTKTLTSVDLLFQLSTLFNLSNFYISDNSPDIVKSTNLLFRSSGYINNYLSFNKINGLSNDYHPKTFKYETPSNNLINLLLVKPLENSIKVSSRDTNIQIPNILEISKKIFPNHIIIPELSIINGLVSEKIRFKIYSMKNIQKVYKSIFSKNNNSIFNLYTKFIELLKLTQNQNLITIFNFHNFLNSYFFISSSLLIDNVIKQNFNNISIQYDDLSVELSANQIPFLKEFLLNIIDKTKINKDIINLKNPYQFVSFNNISSSLSIYFLSTLLFSNLQYKIINNLIDLQSLNTNLPILNSSKREVEKILEIIGFNNHRNINILIMMNRTFANWLAKTLIDIKQNQDFSNLANLINYVESGRIYINQDQVSIISTDQLVTFANPNVVNYLELPLLLSMWLLSSIVLLLIATLIYSKKDIK